MSIDLVGFSSYLQDINGVSHLYIAFWGVICYLPPIKGTIGNSIEDIVF